MKKTLTPLIFAFLVLGFGLLSAVPAPGQFEDLGSGARPAGLGNAFLALADDGNTVFYNPAGMANLEIPELVSSYSRLYLGLTDNSNISVSSAGFVLPVDSIVILGLGWLDFNLLDYYQENTFSVSLAREIFGGLSAGVRANYLLKKYGHDTYTEIDPLFSEKGYSKSGVGFDFGLSYRFDKYGAVSLLGQNLNQPDMGLKDEDLLPWIVRLGIAYEFPILTVAADGSYRAGKILSSIGVEKWWFSHMLALRAGIGLGSDQDRDIAAGTSVRVSVIEFDYAFVYPLSGLKKLDGTHRVSLNVAFGKKERIEERGYFTSQEYEEEMNRLKTAAEEEKAKLEEENAKKMEETEKKAAESVKQTEELKSEVEQEKDKVTALEKENAQLKAEIRPRGHAERKFPASYTVKPGDTLQSIAQEFYGNSQLWNKIFQYNQDKIKRGLPVPGTTIIIP